MSADDNAHDIPDAASDLPQKPAALPPPTNPQSIPPRGSKPGVNGLRRGKPTKPSPGGGGR